MYSGVVVVVLLSLIVIETEVAVAVVVSAEVETEVVTETLVSVVGRGRGTVRAMLLDSCALAPSRRRGKRRGSESMCITMVLGDETRVFFCALVTRGEGWVQGVGDWEEMRVI